VDRQTELTHLKEDWKQYLKELEYEKEAKSKKQQQYKTDLNSQVQYQSTIKVMNAVILLGNFQTNYESQNNKSSFNFADFIIQFYSGIFVQKVLTKLSFTN